MDKTSLKQRWFLLPLGIAALGLLVGGVGLARSQDRAALAERVRQLERQVATADTGRITEVAAAIGPAEKSPTPSPSAAKTKARIAPAKDAPAVERALTSPTIIPAATAAAEQETTAAAWTPPAPSQPTPTPTVRVARATVVIQGQGAFTPEVKSGDTALSILQRAADEAGFGLRIKHYSFGDFVECIGDVCGDNHHYWAFYFNGQYSNIGAGEQPVTEGDSTEWKWEKF